MSHLFSNHTQLGQISPRSRGTMPSRLDGVFARRKVSLNAPCAVISLCKHTVIIQPRAKYVARSGVEENFFCFIASSSKVSKVNFSRVMGLRGGLRRSMVAINFTFWKGEEHTKALLFVFLSQRVM